MRLAEIPGRVVAFFAGPKPETGGRGSLSAQRARDRHAWAYLGAIGRRVANDDPLLAAQGGGDISLWRDILDDDKCYSCFQQRRLALVSRTWEVEPGATDRKSKKAAKFLSDQMKAVGWDNACSLMHYGVWYGHAVGEPIYEIIQEGEWAGLVGMARIDVPDRAWFGYDGEGNLRITDAMGITDSPVPDRKFWSYSSGGDNSFVPYGIGLAHWLFWPVFFKRQGLPFWLKFLEKWGSPTVKGSVSGGHLDTTEGKAKVMEVLRSITSDAAVAIPDWMAVDVLDAARSGEGGFEKLIDRCDAAITQVILSQSMTSDAGPAGLGSNQASVHKDVRDEVVKSDSDLIHESFNRSVAVWLTEWNFPGAVPPRVYRVMDEPEDLKAVADRDTALKGLGWHRTADSFAEVYGDGYEYREAKPISMGGQDQGGNPPPQFAAADVDAIDRLVSALAGKGNEAILAFVAPLKDKLAGVTNPEFLRIALLDFIETMDRDTFAAALADPMLAVRAAAEAGIDVERLA